MEDIGQYHHQRALFEVFGVGEGDGVYVLICGLILGGLTFTACCYCKVYDPLRLWCLKKTKDCCKRKPKPPAEPEPETPPTPDRRHWYLNQTLQIDRRDRDELGPVGERAGLQGGWYGAKNGGFDV
eukprot:g7737.t1